VTKEPKPDVLQVAAETLSIEKQAHLIGTVRVRTQTETVQELASVELDRQDVEIERVAFNREITEAPPIRTEGDVTIIPVVEEIVVVEKRLILKEELHIRRHIVREKQEIPVTLRKQHAVVEREDPENIDKSKRKPK
jgi:uncharacterized protein (TIGR02271 family)